MDQSEQNVVASAQMPKPAALQDTPTKDATFAPTGSPIFDAKGVSIYYGSFRAVTDVSLTIYENEITAFIGPSGCGKTTVLRTLNRLNDLIPEARVEGDVHYRGTSLYGAGVSPIAADTRFAQTSPNVTPLAYGWTSVWRRGRRRRTFFESRSSTVRSVTS